MKNLKAIKKLFVMGVLLSGVSIFACPDLSGTYLCESDDGNFTESTVISQQQAHGTTIYIVNGESLAIADGVEYSVVIPDSPVTASQSSVCEGSVLKMTTKLNATDEEGKNIGALVVVKVSLDGDRNLEIGSEQTLISGTESAAIGSSTEKCLRQ